MLQPSRVAKGARRTDVFPATGDGIPALALIALVIAGLYFGREIFVPMALSVLLSFALSPLVSWLRKQRVPRTLAVVSVVLFAFLGIFAFAYVVATQVSHLGANLPQYQSNIQEKIRSLRSTAGNGSVVERTSEMLRELGEEIEGPEEDASVEEQVAPAPGANGGTGAGTSIDVGDADELEPEPVPVQIQEPDPEPMEVIQSLLGPLIEPLATTGIVIVFVIFMLLQREDLRDRFIRLAGAHDLHRTTEALSDAGKRVARYLLMQLTVNVTYGIPVALGLWLIGVPNPLLWGMLAMVLRFVPYVGPVVGAVLPLALSIAVDPGWTMLFWTAALFIVLELVSNNIIEPWLYGSSTGLSPVAIIVAAIFWTWLWGPIGLLLSTPLTVCLVVLGRHVPQFAFLDVLLGSEPVLTPQESLYQRLLAGDPDEATERAEEFLEKRPLEAFYDEVAIPTLYLVEQDRARGVLDDDRRAIVALGFRTLIENLEEHEDVSPAGLAADIDVDAPEAASEAAPETVPAPALRLIAPASPWRERSVLCIGSRGNLDDAAASMLSQLLVRRGVGALMVSWEALEPTQIGKLDLDGIRIVCLCYMNPESAAHARYLIRRLRRQRSDLRILAGFWSLTKEEAEQRRIQEGTRADILAASLGGAVEEVLDLAARESPSNVILASDAAAAELTADDEAAGRDTDAHPFGGGILESLRPVLP